MHSLTKKLYQCVQFIIGGDLYFMLNGQRITYNSERAVNIRDIGTGENALLCVTDRPSCCSGSGRAGE